MNKDLTVGNPQKVLINFTIPMFISVIFQQLYNIADSVIAGKYAGESALAAVGASYPITMIFMAVALGCQIGCSVIISKYFGAGDYEKTKTCISTSLISGLILSAVLTVVGIIFTAPMMNLVKTPEDIFEDGSLYLRIYVGGFIFLFIYNVATGIFNSLGDSKTPLILLIFSSVGNIFLDALFVIKFSWGVAGVAWATFMAQGVSCIISVIILIFRIKKLKTPKPAPIFSSKALKDILRVSIPSILQQSFVSVGNMFIQAIINSYGSSVIAGYSAAIKLNTFAITSFTTLGNGISSFTAQNLGAGKLERIKKGFRSGVIFALSIALVFFILYFFFGKAFLSLFMNEDSTQLAIDTGLDFMRITSPFYFAVCAKLICDGVLRGSESMNYFMATTFTDLILRVILAFIFSSFWGVMGVWIAWPISWVIAAIMSVMFYCKDVWIRNPVKAAAKVAEDVAEEVSEEISEQVAAEVKKEVAEKVKAEVTAEVAEEIAEDEITEGSK